MSEKARHPNAHPLNAPGDFYVLNEMCIACTAPEHEAPELMAHEETTKCHYHCYFKRQPQTADETERAIRAVFVGCCGSVRYGGRDPEILARFAALRASVGGYWDDLCDQPDEQSPMS
jgi:hypothetical protein